LATELFSAVVRAVRSKSSPASGGLRAFHFHPAAIEQNNKSQLRSHRYEHPKARSYKTAVPVIPKSSNHHIRQSSLGAVFAVVFKTNFMGTNNKPSMNQQDHPHREGQQNNTTPQVQGTGQRVSENNTQQMSDMLNESEEQRSGRAHGQASEEGVQQDERQP